MLRWDSSDPERAPPPLPLNPQSPSLTSRANTSSVIQAHHAALTEKARENTYVTNLSSPERKRNDSSPDRSLVKAAAHKRMQSVQAGHVRDLSSFLESSAHPISKSPERNPTRPSTPYANKDFLLEGKTSEKENNSPQSPTSISKSCSDTPTLRPSLKRTQPNILGENSSPQSATMVALQNISSSQSTNALADISNGSTAMVHIPQSFDGISTQILSLTSIATSLQKEMAALSRRSKDNATDLVSLKAATNARDEDIRKSLRELVSNLNETNSRTSSIFGSAPFLIDDKPHSSIAKGVKTVSLPRIPSSNTFNTSIERETGGSQSPYSMDGAATIALLEKVLREMGTKEGQDLLVGRLTAVADRLAQEGISTAKRLEDLVQYIKDNTNDTRALIMHDGISSVGIESPRNRGINSEEARLELDYEKPKSGPMVSRVENLLKSGSRLGRTASGAGRGTDVLNDEILKAVRSVKDSVAQGGGLTAEVKALVRELRGEVLGMGRELGRKLDQAPPKDHTIESDREDERVIRVVQEGLEELKEQMGRILHESSRQSIDSIEHRQKNDSQELFKTVKAAFIEHHRTTSQDLTLRKADIIEAVKLAWEDYKPDIELQHFGLERDEILECLKEGMQQYSPQESNPEIGGASREEVFAAITEGLKHFSPPPVEIQASLSREEILDAVRECLEEFEFPVAPSAATNSSELTREDMVYAVKEGLESFEFPEQILVEAVREGFNSFEFPDNTMTVSRDVINNLSREDILDTLKSGLVDYSASLSNKESVEDKLQQIIDSMRAEFQAVSEEAKQNVAAHGRDTEQLLDSHKDGMEKLRSDIEGYVDRASGVDIKEDILQDMRESFGVLQAELVAATTKGSLSSVDAIKEELDNIRESLTCSLVPSNTLDRDEIVTALRDGLDGLRADIDRPRGGGESIISGTGEILDAFHDGLESLRAEVEKIATKPAEPMDMTVNYEILDTLRSGLEGVRTDIDRLRETHQSDREVAAVGSGAVITSEGHAEGLKRNDIENLEVLITQLKIKVEALESIQMPVAEPHPQPLAKEDLDSIHEAIRSLQASVTSIACAAPVSAEEATVRKEDFEALETLLRNTKASIDEMDPEQAVKKEHLDIVELVVRETRDGMCDISSQLNETSKREDLTCIENLIHEVVAGLEEVKERIANPEHESDRVVKSDVETVEAVCRDVKSQIEQVLLADLTSLAHKDDLNGLGELIKEFKERIEVHAEENCKAFEERQAETVGVSERITEVKVFLEDFQNSVKEKLDQGSTGVEALGQVLSGFKESLDESAVGAKQLLETLSTEFERSNAGVVGSKLEADEQFEKIGLKFDEKFNELMTKYDDAQQAADAKASISDEKDSLTQEALDGMRVLAEELKLLIDTLGSTITESVEQTEEASRTVFAKVEATFTRVEETHADSKADQQLTREQVLKAINAVEEVGGSINEYHPKILDSIKEVLMVVGQHYEHSKTTADVIGEHYQHSKSTADTLQEKIEARPVSSDGQKDTALLEDVPRVEKYDDTEVHEKLDKLVDHMSSASKTFSQLDILDKIHTQVMDTAAEVSSFVCAQTQRIVNDHEGQEKAVEAATIALEKSLAQKEVVEAGVVHLREEEGRLREAVLSLKADQSSLAHQKMLLSRDVSSLEMALKIRREELHAMEARAEGLERRILEGVIDHSRAFLINKSSLGKAGRDAMNLKRVPSHASSTNGRPASLSGRRNGLNSTTQSAVSMAMCGNRSAPVPPTGSPAGASRRNFSLSQITNNTQTGGMKRSHSVKANGGPLALRKSSWGGSINGGRKSYGYGELNKENLALKENEEETRGNCSDDDLSDSGTMRRSSGGLGTLTGSEFTESTIDEGTEWTGTDIDENESPNGNVVLYGDSQVV